MHHPTQRAGVYVAIVVIPLLASVPAARAADKDMLPPQLPPEQRERLLRFLQQHEKPEHFLPRDARLVGSRPAIDEVKNERVEGKPVKQYTVQVLMHRPVPGQEKVDRVDVYYYRPNPEKGKPGITVRHTVDLNTGKQVGQTEVLLNHHTPISRDELNEAVALAREKIPAVQALYKARGQAVRWEYLQMMINRKHPPHEPGDRVVRLVYSAPAVEGQEAATPVRVIVNLTKGVVVKDER